MRITPQRSLTNLNSDKRQGLTVSCKRLASLVKDLQRAAREAKG